MVSRQWNKFGRTKPKAQNSNFKNISQPNFPDLENNEEGLVPLSVEKKEKEVSSTFQQLLKQPPR